MSVVICTAFIVSIPWLVVVVYFIDEAKTQKRLHDVEHDSKVFWQQQTETYKQILVQNTVTFKTPKSISDKPN